MFASRVSLATPELGVTRLATNYLFAGDGVLQPDELAEVFKLCGFNLTPNQIKEVVEKADVNGDGVIDYKEFVPIATQLLRRGEGRGKGHGRHRVDKDGRYVMSQFLRWTLLLT